MCSSKRKIIYTYNKNSLIKSQNIMSKSKKQKKITKNITPIVQNAKFTFIKRVALFVLALSIISFNVLVKIDVKAGNNSEAITIENLLRAHNEYRKEQGVPELKLSNLLIVSSGQKGQIMIDNQCWSHYCPQGKSPWDFFDDAQYDYIYAGENLAEGYYTIDTVMQAWINSKTHRDNIIKPEFTEIGFSILYGDYLNNSNNVLVVAHFGSTANGAEVFSAQNPEVQITSPEDNYQTTSESLDISGTVTGLDDLEVFNNNQLDGNADISGGIFTYRIDKLSQGNNSIWVSASNSNTELSSNKINVIFNQPLAESTNYELVSSSEEGFSIALENKNLINLVFIAFLIVIFLADIILVSRTSALSSKKSFSHYHVGLFVLLALIIAIGGFAGQIQNGITN